MHTCLMVTASLLHMHVYPQWVNGFFLFFFFLAIMYPLVLEKEIATHSSILAWRIPWTEEPGEL